MMSLGGVRVINFDKLSFAGSIYGLLLTLRCPNCEEVVSLSYDYDGNLEQAIHKAAVGHRRCIPPSSRWMPEQLGFIKGD